VTDAATVTAMNVPVRDRIAQVRVNLERARWVLGGLEQDFMLVNLPAFKAYLIRGSRNVWESRTQIGEEAMQTPTFRATIRTVVFNPDWTVPPTILQNEIFEDMRAGKNVIEDKGLVIYDASNHVVDSNSIHWDAVTADAFPYTIKQPPGDENALGKVKFCSRTSTRSISTTRQIARCSRRTAAPSATVASVSSIRWSLRNCCSRVRTTGTRRRSNSRSRATRHTTSGSSIHCRS
jgi:murein L,D-transpeptidase YcbB/YkuD